MKRLTVTNRCFLHPPVTVEVGGEMCILKFNESRTLELESDSELTVKAYRERVSGRHTIDLTQDREVKISRSIRDIYYIIATIIMLVLFGFELTDNMTSIFLSGFIGFNSILVILDSTAFRKKTL